MIRAQRPRTRQPPTRQRNSSLARRRLRPDTFVVPVGAGRCKAAPSGEAFGVALAGAAAIGASLIGQADAMGAVDVSFAVHAITFVDVEVPVVGAAGENCGDDGEKKQSFEGLHDSWRPPFFSGKDTLEFIDASVRPKEHYNGVLSLLPWSFGSFRNRGGREARKKMEVIRCSGVGA